MRSDLYLRVVLTIIAGALVYLCVILTPMPIAEAQTIARGAQRPGDDTGPAEVVIVGWRPAQNASFPVHVNGLVAVSGGVEVTNDVRVTGRVETQQAARAVDRVSLISWEERSVNGQPGQIRTLDGRTNVGLPVTVVPRTP